MYIHALYGIWSEHWIVTPATAYICFDSETEEHAPPLHPQQCNFVVTAGVHNVTSLPTASVCVRLLLYCTI